MHRALLCVIFCLSGASALIFESAWFQLLGLTVGNSVWASTIVLGAFMAGLALGSALVARRGDRIARPVRLFAVLELLIGVTGLGVILVLPHLTPLLQPLFQGLEGGAGLNGLRAVVAFALLLVPAAAMGMTLPVLVGALRREGDSFGRVIALLYGCNTLGAAGGVLLGELVVMPALGLRGAGVVALLCNVLNAVTALLAARRVAPVRATEAQPPAVRVALRGASGRILLAAFLCGFCLLGLEVLWFRFLLGFHSGLGLNFAIMLAVVLLGIAAGGLLASWWFKRDEAAHGYLPPLLGAAGAYVLFAYSGYQLVAIDLFPDRLVVAALFLMLPVAVISGAAFTMLGRALHDEVGDDVRSTGVLTVANTLGGATGSLVAGLVLLPLLGVELAFVGVAAAYGAVSFAVRGLVRDATGAARGRVHLAAVGVLLLAAATYRYGHMEATYSLVAHQKLVKGGERRVLYREGPLATLQYMQSDLLGAPYYHRLCTNDHSMSATTEAAKRYMKLYVYWPMAVRPEARDALLFCFGCGSTAKALTDTKELEHIDIVDISEDVLAASDVVFPDEATNPLNDPRVRTHIEDGRFFLQTTGRRFDIITAEPPPLRYRGVAGLYTEEFFRLAHDRLTDKGVLSYWLPINQVSVAQAKAVVRAFTDVFEHASLWQGAGFNLMLIGMRSTDKPVDLAAFTRQWNRKPTSTEVRMLGLLSPEQLGSLFIADRPRLREWCGDVPPLTDEFAVRLGHDAPGPEAPGVYRALMDWRTSRTDFRASPLVASIWPEPLIAAADDHFRLRNLINDMLTGADLREVNAFEALHACMSHPALRDYQIWTLGSTFAAQRRISIETEAPRDFVALARQHPDASLHLAARAVFEGKPVEAAAIYGALARNLPAGDPQRMQLTGYRIYLLYRAGEKDAAKRAMGEFLGPMPTPEQRRGGDGFWRWLAASLD